MKTIMFILISALLLSKSAMAQNRILEWDAGKITAIRAEVKSNSGSNYVREINARESMDTVFNFLRQTEFMECKDPSLDKSSLLSQWIIRLTFEGHHDEIIVCKEYAAIGKTLFAIDKKAVKELKKIITHCGKC